jgi:hypothetical protein
MRKIKLLVSIVTTLILLLPFQTSSIFAATTYWSGDANFNSKYQTGKFYMPQGEKVMDFTKYASSNNASFRIEIRNNTGDLVDKCFSYAYVDKSGYNAQCFFKKIPSGGNYYLLFVNETPNTTVHIPKYNLHD